MADRPTKPGYYWWMGDGTDWEPVRISGPYPAEYYPSFRDHGLWIDDTGQEDWPLSEDTGTWGPEIVPPEGLR